MFETAKHYWLCFFVTFAVYILNNTKTKSNMRKNFLLAAMTAALLCPTMASAQWQRQITPGDTLQSVRVLPNGNTVFSIYAPKATQVNLTGDIQAMGQPTQNNGIWSFVVKGVKPGAYRYSFIVDGVQVIDPKSEVATQNRPVAIVEPNGLEFFSYNPQIEHGAVAVRSYWSKTANMTRTMRVWTPAGYEKSKTKLPVLYLVHGGGDTDTSWPTAGCAGDILDNLYAQGKIEPMIVVMPNGTFAGDEVPIFAADMVTDIIPFVEKNYRVKADQAHRAMAGLSMGGMETLETVFNNPTMFGYVWVLSSSFAPGKQPAEEAKRLGCEQKIPVINKTVKEFVFTQGGQSDIAYQNGINTRNYLKEAGLKFEYMDVEGGHSWYAWRQNLYDLAQRIFK